MIYFDAILRLAAALLAAGIAAVALGVCIFLYITPAFTSRGKEGFKDEVHNRLSWLKNDVLKSPREE